MPHRSPRGSDDSTIHDHDNSRSANVGDLSAARSRTSTTSELFAASSAATKAILMTLTKTTPPITPTSHSYSHRQHEEDCALVANVLRDAKARESKASAPSAEWQRSATAAELHRHELERGHGEKKQGKASNQGKNKGLGKRFGKGRVRGYTVDHESADRADASGKRGERRGQPRMGRTRSNTTANGRSASLNEGVSANMDGDEDCLHRLAALTFSSPEEVNKEIARLEKLSRVLDQRKPRHREILAELESRSHLQNVSIRKLMDAKGPWLVEDLKTITAEEKSLREQLQAAVDRAAKAEETARLSAHLGQSQDQQAKEIANLAEMRQQNNLAIIQLEKCLKSKVCRQEQLNNIACILRELALPAHHRNERKLSDSLNERYFLGAFTGKTQAALREATDRMGKRRRAMDRHQKCMRDLDTAQAMLQGQIVAIVSHNWH